MTTPPQGPAARPLLSVVTSCYNEEENVRALYEAVRDVMAKYPAYRYEHIFIDNASRDGTRRILRDICAADCNVKAIFNARNFGAVRSGMHVLMQAHGAAVLALACDFQDPPALLGEFITKWEQGAKLVLAVKTSSSEHSLFYAIRGWYYRLLGRISEAPPVMQATGFGMYDRAVIEHLRRINDPYPFFRGLLSEVGYEPVLVPFHQPRRRRGISSQNFYSLYDQAFLGITSHSKVPLRLATMLGFVLGVLSVLAGLGYLVAKLLFWNSFSLGVAPILVGFFFLTSVQLFFIGIVGEYVGTIWTHVRDIPHVFELERINFE
ncbi:MAG: glycosyltransferase family 2 protein [Gemmatimonadaceae bacterium]|nr:glycosyltransferase family 2 protein [Gemmatimonadaceae bacterium]